MSLGRLRRFIAVATAAGLLAVGVSLTTPSAAAAANPLKPVCGVAGLVSGLVGKACGVLQNGGRIVSAGKKLLSGHLGAAAKTLVGGTTAKTGVALGLGAVASWVLGGAQAAITGTAKLIGSTTSPQLTSTWFSSTYWRMAELAAVLTLPFLFAAAVQAVLRSDMALLVRAAFGHLPLAMLAVGIAAPLTMLLLAASDQMSAIVSSAAGGNGARALGKLGVLIGVASKVDGSAFLAFLIGLLLTAGAVVLWLELLVREAAVYVVVLMLPLAFAALVWPARRIWAIRAVELLVALILAKFVIVAVLTLAAASLGHSLFAGPDAMFAGLALVILATFAPWALLRLLPMAELASSAAGSLRREAMVFRGPGAAAEAGAEAAAEAIKAPTSDDQTADVDPPNVDGAHAVQEHLQQIRTGHAADERVANGNGSVAPADQGRPGEREGDGLPAGDGRADDDSYGRGNGDGDLRSDEHRRHAREDDGRDHERDDERDLGPLWQDDVVLGPEGLRPGRLELPSDDHEDGS